VTYKIKLVDGATETRDKQLVVYRDGQFFGERALENDEPRSATVITLSYTELISIAKDVYMEILKAARSDIDTNRMASVEQLSWKENVIKTLSKARRRRNNSELEGAASYLLEKIPYFSKNLSSLAMIELCRVAETVTLWGRSVLFKHLNITTLQTALV
jgi:CRP-like cAMP-binding protein